LTDASGNARSILSLSRTTIDSDHVEWNRGFNRFNFRFDDLDGIGHTVEKTPI
jgi:hypothetical protein